MIHVWHGSSCNIYNTKKSDKCKDNNPGPLQLPAIWYSSLAKESSLPSVDSFASLVFLFVWPEQTADSTATAWEVKNPENEVEDADALLCWFKRSDAQLGSRDTSWKKRLKSSLYVRTQVRRHKCPISPVGSMQVVSQIGSNAWL